MLVNPCLSMSSRQHARSPKHFQKYVGIYSRTSDNGPSEKRTTSLQRTLSVLRIEITILVILKQPPRSGRFSIPDSGQNPRSQRHFTMQKLPLNSEHQETTPLKLYIHTAYRPPIMISGYMRSGGVGQDHVETFLLIQR